MTCGLVALGKYAQPTFIIKATNWTLKYITQKSTMSAQIHCKRTYGLISCYRWFDYFGTLCVGGETTTQRLTFINYTFNLNRLIVCIKFLTPICPCVSMPFSKLNAVIGDNMLFGQPL